MQDKQSATCFDSKVDLMRTLMYDAGYNWSFCYDRSNSKTVDTFKSDFPKAYKKIMAGDTNISKADMMGSPTSQTKDLTVQLSLTHKMKGFQKT